MQTFVRVLPTILPVISVGFILLWSYLKWREIRLFARNAVVTRHGRLRSSDDPQDMPSITLDEVIAVDEVIRKARKGTRDHAYLGPIRKSGLNASSFRLGMQVVVSLVVLGCAIFIIMSQQYDAKDKHWAYGSAGTILGFWLKR